MNFNLLLGFALTPPSARPSFQRHPGRGQTRPRTMGRLCVVVKIQRVDQYFQVAFKAAFASGMSGIMKKYLECLSNRPPSLNRIWKSASQPASQPASQSVSQSLSFSAVSTTRRSTFLYFSNVIPHFFGSVRVLGASRDCLKNCGLMFALFKKHFKTFIGLLCFLFIFFA